MNFSQFVRQTTVGWMLFFLIVLFVCSTPEVGYSQSNDSTTTEQVEGEKSEAKGINLLSLLFKGGWFMLPLMVLSGLIVAISVERIIALRAEKTIPPQFVESLGKLSMQSEGFDPRNAYRLCQGHPSSSARVVQAMLLKVGRPISEVESTVSETAQREADRLQSPIRWLELSAAIAPLIGLLGTVWGVTQAFYETTQLTAGQNKAAVLADGIYTALVTTICGLIIAIPAIVSFRLLEGKIESIFHRIDEMMQNLIPQVERFEGQIRFADPNSPVLSQPGNSGSKSRDSSSRKKPPAVSGRSSDSGLTDSVETANR